MSVPASTGFIVSLLERLRIDPVLIGDIVEQFAQNRSRVWLWRQVTAAVALALIGYAREPRPFVRREVRLTAMPAGSPVGGLGFLALAILLSVVAPDIWWVIAAAAVGGIVLGAALIVIRRRCARRSPVRTIFVVALLGIMTVSADARGEQQRGPAVRLDPVDGTIEAFQSHQLVMLPGGHGVVVEFGSSR